MKKHYFEGLPKAAERIEIEVQTGISGKTECVINIDYLLNGFRTYRCGNGEDYRLSYKEMLEILKEVKAGRGKYTDQRFKCANGWKASGIRSLEDYCFPGDLVAHDLVDELVNCMPPLLLSAACTQTGEALDHIMDDRTGRYAPIYATFHRVNSDMWRFDGYCFRGENINQRKEPPKLDRWIGTLEVLIAEADEEQAAERG